MKVVLLAGGLGTRLSEETTIRPKPMVELGGMPILWHIMKMYGYYGFNEFVVCLGYKGYMIKEFFTNYFIHQSDVTVDLCKNSVEIHKNASEPWKVTLVDTGVDSMTGGRIKRIEEYIDGTFMLTYGDGVSDIDLKELLRYHRSNKVAATLTGVKPAGKWGQLEIDDRNHINKFMEKPVGDGGYVNGGFFVLEPKIFDYIQGDSTIWERDPLEGLARDGELCAYKFDGFWHAMDTLRDRSYLEELVEKKKAPWMKW